jgi:hypothetical protein
MRNEFVVESQKPKRGLAAMSPERRREIAQRGNQRLREQGKIHKYTSESGKSAVSKRKDRQDGEA